MQILGAIADLWIAAIIDLGRMYRRMWPALLQIGVLYVVAVMVWFTVPHVLQSWLGIYVARYLVLVGCAFATSPFFVALHRFVAFGEVTWLPSRDAYTEAAPYAAWSGVVLLVQMGPIILFFAMLGLTGHPSAAGLMVFLALPCAFSTLIRVTTLLPMAALDPRHATWRAAVQQTRNRFWFIWTATSASALPAWLALAILVRFGGPIASSSLFSVLMIASMLATQLLPLSVSTRLFRQYRAEAAPPTLQPPRWPTVT